MGGLALERWAREAVEAELVGDFTPRASARVTRNMQDFATLHMLTWKARQQRIIDSGDPVNMPEGTYAGLLAYPPGGTVTTTSIAGTVNLWPQATYSPLPANSFLTPQAYRVAILAKITTGATPGNIGLDPRIGAGTWTTGGTAITGTTLGASGNVALTASITNAFYYVMGDLTIRSVGAPGANAATVGMFHYVSTQATAGGLAGPAAVGTGHNLIFGGTNASFDFTTAQGFGLGAVHTVTTITHNIEQIHFMDWN